MRTVLLLLLAGVAGLLLAVTAFGAPKKGPPAKKTTTTTTTTTTVTWTTIPGTTTVPTTTTVRTTTTVAAPPPPAIADISLQTLAAAGGSVFADTRVTSTSVVTNSGPNDATGVYVVVQQQGAQVIAATSSIGTCTESGEIDCALGSLASGASAVVTVTSTPSPGSTRVAFSTRAGANELDPQTANNASRTDTPVLKGHAGAPGLATPGGAFQPPLFARQTGNTRTVTSSVHLDEPATIYVQVLNAAGRAVSMLPRTLVDYLPAGKPHKVIPHIVDRAGWVPLQLRIGGPAGKLYRIVVRAKGADGASSTTSVIFRT